MGRVSEQGLGWVSGWGLESNFGMRVGVEFLGKASGSGFGVDFMVGVGFQDRS